MHLGEMKFKKKSGKDDQAMPDGTEAAGNVAKLLGMVFLSISCKMKRSLKYSCSICITIFNSISYI